MYKEIKISSPGMCLLTNVNTCILFLGANLLLLNNTDDNTLIEIVTNNNWTTHRNEYIIYVTDILYKLI